jgi:hypothetical protein
MTDETTDKTTKFPLKDGSEVELECPVNFAGANGEQMLLRDKFVATDGSIIDLADIDMKKWNSDHTQWLIRQGGKDYVSAVSEHFRKSDALDNSDD